MESINKRDSLADGDGLRMRRFKKSGADNETVE